MNCSVVIGHLTKGRARASSFFFVRKRESSCLTVNEYQPQTVCDDLAVAADCVLSCYFAEEGGIC